MNAYSEIFTRDENKNIKDNYKIHWLKQDQDSGLMEPSVNNFMNSRKKKGNDI